MYKIKTKVDKFVPIFNKSGRKTLINLLNWKKSFEFDQQKNKKCAKIT